MTGPSGLSAPSGFACRFLREFSYFTPEFPKFLFP